MTVDVGAISVVLKRRRGWRRPALRGDLRRQGKYRRRRPRLDQWPPAMGDDPFACARQRRCRRPSSGRRSAACWKGANGRDGLQPDGRQSALWRADQSAAPDRHPGGSSSGSAVAVAAGLVSFSIGTDTAESCRRPQPFAGSSAFGLARRHNHGRRRAARPFSRRHRLVRTRSRPHGESGRRALAAAADDRGFETPSCSATLSRASRRPLRRRPRRLSTFEKRGPGARRGWETSFSRRRLRISEIFRLVRPGPRMGPGSPLQHSNLWQGRRRALRRRLQGDGRTEEGRARLSRRGARAHRRAAWRRGIPRHADGPFRAPLLTESEEQLDAQALSDDAASSDCELFRPAADQPCRCQTSEARSRFPSSAAAAADRQFDCARPAFLRTLEEISRSTAQPPATGARPANP